MYYDQINVSQWTAAPLQIALTSMINAAPDILFHALNNPAMMCQVFSWMKDVTVTSPNVGEVTSVGSIRTCILENGLVLEEEIIDWQPPQGYAFRGIDATHPFGMRGHVVVLSFTPVVGGCQMTWQHYFEHSNVPAMRKQLEQSMTAAVNALQRQFGGCASG